MSSVQARFFFIYASILCAKAALISLASEVEDLRLHMMTTESTEVPSVQRKTPKQLAEEISLRFQNDKVLYSTARFNCRGAGRGYKLQTPLQM